MLWNLLLGVRCRFRYAAIDTLFGIGEPKRDRTIRTFPGERHAPPNGSADRSKPLEQGMSFPWSGINRALRQRRKLHHASEAGRLRDRRESDGTEPVRQNGPTASSTARRPCANSLVLEAAQRDTSRSNSRPVSRSSPLTQSLSGSAPGVTAVAKFRAKIPLNGVRADVKLPDPSPKG